MKKKDRISNLPDYVLHQVLSFLDMKEVIQTSVLSRRWKEVWKSHPFLKFDHTGLVKKKRFEDFVSKVYLSHSSDIHTFHLKLPSNTHTFGRQLHSPWDVKRKSLVKWIETAITRNIQELHISGGRSRIHLPFDFKLLRILIFDFGTDTFYHRKLHIPDSMSLPRLEKLSLCGVKLCGVGDVLKKLLSRCPLLESLSISYCKPNCTTIGISSLRLKYLKLHFMGNKYKYMIELYAPNLISFTCERFLWKGFDIGSFPCLVKAELELYESYPNAFNEVMEISYAKEIIKLLRAFRNVGTLKLSGWVTQLLLLEAPNLLQNRLEFPNLKSLKVTTWFRRNCVNAIVYLLESSPIIEEFVLDTESTKYMVPLMDDSSSLEALSLQHMLYHLKKVQIFSSSPMSSGDCNVVSILEIVLKKAIVLETVEIHCSHNTREVSKEVQALQRAASTTIFLLFDSQYTSCYNSSSDKWF